MGSYCVQCLQQESRAAQLENENAELKARLEEFKVYNRLRFFCLNASPFSPQNRPPSLPVGRSAPVSEVTNTLLNLLCKDIASLSSRSEKASGHLNGLSVPIFRVRQGDRCRPERGTTASTVSRSLEMGAFPGMCELSPRENRRPAVYWGIFQRLTALAIWLAAWPVANVIQSLLLAT